MKPEQLFQAFADVIADVCKKPFRATALTPDEWDLISERVLLLAKEQKGPSANQEEKK